MSAVRKPSSQRSSVISATPDEPRGANDEPFPRVSAAAGTTYEAALARGPDDARLARQLRRTVQHILAEFPRGKRAAIFITGPGSAPHAVDVAGLLARELAQQQMQTLIVDADGEQRVLSQRFAATGALALSDVVVDGLTPRRAILKSLIPGLEVMPYGTATPTRRTVEFSQVRALIDGLLSTHTYVIVSAGGTRDVLSRWLARCCDATYLVVRLGLAEHKEVTEAVDYWTNAGARILGAIATAVPV